MGTKSPSVGVNGGGVKMLQSWRVSVENAPNLIGVSGLLKKAMAAPSQTRVNFFPSGTLKSIPSPKSYLRRNGAVKCAE